MTTYGAELRSCLTVLFPEGTKPDEVPFVTRGEQLSRGAEAAVSLGHLSTSEHAQAFPNRYLLWAVPKKQEFPRALVPDADLLAARTLLAPRSSHPTRFRRVLHRGITDISSSAMRWIGQPVTIFARERSKVVVALQKAVPGCAIGCYLGNVGNHGRISVQAFDHGTVRAVAKVVQGDSDRVRMDQWFQSRHINTSHVEEHETRS